MIRQRGRPSLKDLEPMPVPRLLSEYVYFSTNRRPWRPPLRSSAEVVFRFPAGMKVQHALELMSNGSCGD